MVTSEQRRRPRPWAIALGLIAVVMVPLLAVAAMAAGDDTPAGCDSAAEGEQAMLTRAVLDVLPAGSVRDVAKNSDYDEDCEFGATEVTAHWDQAKGRAMVEVLEAKGWRRAAGDAPEWFVNDEPATGAAGTTNDNDSPNMVFIQSIDGRDADLAVDREGLHALIARGPIS